MGMTMWYQGDPKDLMPHYWLWRCNNRAILKIWFGGSARYLHRPWNFTIFRGWKTPSVWHCVAVALCVAASGLLGAVRGETSVTSPWLHYPAVCDHSKALLGVRAETPSADELPPHQMAVVDVFHVLDFTSWPCACTNSFTSQSLIYSVFFFHLKKLNQPRGRCGPSVNRLLWR